MSKLKTLAASVALALAAGPAHAALIDLGDGTVLDDATNLIWLQDWSANGTQPFATQVSWADSLNFAGSSDWALPTIEQYAALFAGVGGDLRNVAQFINVQPTGPIAAYYWSSTPFLDLPCGGWVFRASDGGEQGCNKHPTEFAVAVRNADPATIPEAPSLPLAILALGATALVTRRRSS